MNFRGKLLLISLIIAIGLAASRKDFAPRLLWPSKSSPQSGNYPDLRDALANTSAVPSAKRIDLIPHPPIENDPSEAAARLIPGFSLTPRSEDYPSGVNSWHLFERQPQGRVAVSQHNGIVSNFIQSGADQAGAAQLKTQLKNEASASAFPSSRREKAFSSIPAFSAQSSKKSKIISVRPKQSATLPQESPQQANKAGRRSNSSNATAAAAAARSARLLQQRKALFKRFRPILLSRMLGKGALRPPKGVGKSPDFAALREKIPHRLPDGKIIKPVLPSPAEIEALAPPDAKALAGKPPEPARFHWHQDGPVSYFHEQSIWGRWSGGHWTWLGRSDNRWWIEAPASKALLWHAQHWWWKNKEMWFLLHEGEPWGYRYFAEWKEEGLIHPGSGTQMIYSSDGSRVALVTPGHGAVLFDAETGRELGRWSEEQMPKRPSPKIPASFSFPRN